MEGEIIEGTGQTEPNGNGTPVDWRAESRKWESRSKENFKALGEMKAENEANAAKVAELIASLAAANSELAAFRSERDAAQWRADASKETGVPAELLRGSTAEEVMAHAKLLQPHFASRPAPYVGSEGGPSSVPSGSARDIFAKALENLL